ncbi:hypothetical protein D3C76_1211030 [compost metagenome]
MNFTVSAASGNARVSCFMETSPLRPINSVISRSSSPVSANIGNNSSSGNAVSSCTSPSEISRSAFPFRAVGNIACSAEIRLHAYLLLIQSASSTNSGDKGGSRSNTSWIGFRLGFTRVSPDSKETTKPWTVRCPNGTATRLPTSIHNFRDSGIL